MTSPEKVLGGALSPNSALGFVAGNHVLAGDLVLMVDVLLLPGQLNEPAR